MCPYFVAPLRGFAPCWGVTGDSYWEIVCFVFLRCVQSSVLTAFLKTKVKLNSVARVRDRTMPTERPPLVGEVSADFLRIEGGT
jgi:hypothetical protein